MGLKFQFGSWAQIKWNNISVCSPLVRLLARCLVGLFVFRVFYSWEMCARSLTRSHIHTHIHTPENPQLAFMATFQILRVIRLMFQMFTHNLLKNHFSHMQLQQSDYFGQDMSGFFSLLFFSHHLLLKQVPLMKSKLLLKCCSSSFIGILGYQITIGASAVKLRYFGDDHDNGNDNETHYIYPSEVEKKKRL